MDRFQEEQLVAAFENDGFCVMPSVLSDSEASAMRSMILEVRFPCIRVNIPSGTCIQSQVAPPHADDRLV